MNIPTKFWFQLAQWFQKRRLKTDNILFDIFWPLVSVRFFWSPTKIHILSRGPSNDHSYPTQFCSNWSSSFRKEDYKQTTPFLTPLIWSSCFFCVLPIRHAGHLPGAPRTQGSHANLRMLCTACFVFFISKHSFCWKYQYNKYITYNKYMFNFYLFTCNLHSPFERRIF